MLKLFLLSHYCKWKLLDNKIYHLSILNWYDPVISDSNVFKLCRDSTIISQLLSEEKKKYLEFEELTADNADVLLYFFNFQFFTDKNLYHQNPQTLCMPYLSTKTHFFNIKKQTLKNIEFNTICTNADLSMT